MRASLFIGLMVVMMTACSPAQKPVPPDSAPTPSASASTSTSSNPPPPPPEDAAAPSASASASASVSVAVADAGPPAKVKVKIVTIGMHVAGGPFDEPTKEPFKKAVEPHFPEIAQCWGKHVTKLPVMPSGGKPFVDVGVDLLIEATGGHPKTSNPRLTPKLDADAAEFLPCVISVFETVEFPKLVDRGRTGVSYSLRFTPTP